MALKYAKNQPAGFVNRIQNVAVVGAAGQQGHRITDALVATGKFNVTGITRADSKNAMPKGVTAKYIDYSQQSSIIDAVKGQDVLIITLPVTAAPEQEDNLIRAAAEAGVPYIMPNQWGPEYDAVKDEIPKLGEAREKARKLIQSLGASCLVTICGYWYEYSLAIPGAFGFDMKNKKIKLYSDGDKKVNTSTWEQVGRGVAGLLSLKRYPEDANDTSERVLSRFENKYAYIDSFCVSQKDMFDSVLRVTGTQASDWEVKKEAPADIYTRSMAALKQGDFSAFIPAIYSRMFYPEAGDYPRPVDNELLGLPKEDLDACTKEAIRRAML